MEALTPSERRGALLVVLLLALGAAHDLWRANRPPPAGPPAAWGPATREGALPEGEGPSPAGSGSTPGDLPGAPQVLDLNRASRSELEALPGIGPVLAERIVSHRERHGPFRTREELLAVRGIGPRLFERLRTRVVAMGDEPRPAGAARDSAGGTRARSGSP